MSNPAVYFEIPVTDLVRAIKFYSTVFNFSFEQEVFDDLDMAYFPFNNTHRGITGALVKGEIYKPTVNGILLYLNTTDIQQTLECAQSIGAEVLFPINIHKELGFAVAEFKDSEGNRIGLHQTL
ncbi:VOC family protein [Myroides marinus]|uniref:Glyoxalase n=1 Tax=Myroides marinus TaxID=703342 RepID=A0A163UZM9_9FLAO|nr:VOC family protein [Myroides marinus]KUF44242.1 glyoxalase [Myroides marinus]KZE74108.1 glyoxalase [Myroides marinus]MDM1346556.1 VOC family protein [Myroides marinus]MDM1349961.1 VOC family protein [Myroides marinus]MDM1353468.1 VOC family protein [Myroides marinus]